MLKIKYIQFLLSILVISLSVFLVLSNQKDKSSEIVTRNTSKDSILTLVKYGQIDQAMDLARQLLNKQQITLDECHTSLHLAGHQAYALNPDLVKLSRNDLELCGRGFQHGVEAQIVVEGQDITNKLRQYCSILEKDGIKVSCLHGAGHEFLREGLDINKAIMLCDEVSGDNTLHAQHCYTGIFSEYSLQVLGMDGDSNLPIPGGPAIQADKSDPLKVCSEVQLPYQSSCGEMLSRVAVDFLDQDKSYETCLKGYYSEELKAACVQNMSETLNQKPLFERQDLLLPKAYPRFTKKMRQAYIRGLGQEFNVLIVSGVEQDREKVCSIFKDKDDNGYCLEILKSN
jgi:hypothetical protein